LEAGVEETPMLGSRPFPIFINTTPRNLLPTEGCVMFTKLFYGSLATLSFFIVLVAIVRFFNQMDLVNWKFVAAAWLTTLVFVLLAARIRQNAPPQGLG